MRSIGVTMKGVLVAIFVMLVTALILVYVEKSIGANRSQVTDAIRMRNVYVAISMYETLNDGSPPSNLLVLRRDLADDQQFLASDDPFKSDMSFPIDPAFPNAPARSPIRISFSYLPYWAESKRMDVESWESAQKNLKLGILASYWYGSVDFDHPDGRDCHRSCGSHQHGWVRIHARSPIQPSRTNFQGSLRSAPALEPRRPPSAVHRKPIQTQLSNRVDKLIEIDWLANVRVLRPDCSSPRCLAPRPKT